ncbi:hypothetical protein [Pradoshia sp.]
MKGRIKKSIISFECSLNLAGEEDIYYDAVLFNERDEYRLYIKPQKGESFEKIHFRSRRWNDEISYYNFGEYLILKDNVASIDKSIIRLDLSKSKLLAMKSKIDSSHSLFYFVLDGYSYSYESSNEEIKVTYYLNYPSKEIIRNLNLIDFDFVKRTEKANNKRLLNGKYCIIPDLNGDYYTAIVEYANDAIEGMEKLNRAFLDIASFYFSAPIEVYKSIVQDENRTIVTYQQPKYKLQNSSFGNKDLTYLCLNEREFCRFENFLEFISWENIDLLHTPINDYIRASFLDESSRFLLLFSVLETFATRNTRKPKSKKLKCANGLKDFLNETLFPQYYEKIKEFVGESDINIEIFKDKWKDFTKKLLYFSSPDTIAIYLEKCNFNWAKINQEIIDAKLKNIGDIRQLRNKLTHDRYSDYTEKLPMGDINSKLSFVVCIILLMKLGMDKIKFDEGYKELDLFKKQKND